MGTPIHEVATFGQSIWYDNLRRSMFASGELVKMIEKDGLLGMTSNPSIFEKAIGSSADYDAAIGAYAKAHPQAEPLEIFEHLAIDDIRHACDAFRPVYDRLSGRDGFVSLEVSPRLARDEHKTFAEAQRLWTAVDRPNLMIKIPGTPECVPAIRRAIAAGININTTLLFSVHAYVAVAEAYIAGLEERHEKGHDVSKVHGVASFFLSRIDTMVDKQLGDAHKELQGKAAIANAKIAYGKYHELINTPKWRKLAAAGAHPQRLLWASTGTKNPAYPKLMYVEQLIGPDTVNTIPGDTYDELRDHGAGHVHDTLGSDLNGAQHTLAAIEKAGVSIKHVTDTLLVDGVKAFEKSFDTLLAAVADKRAKLAGGK
jgi:transaldolase/glucose-6-phosphate isomerase